MRNATKMRKITGIYVRFVVLTTVTMKSAIFWDVTPRSLVDVYQQF
jgi:hypothetical protein